MSESIASNNVEDTIGSSEALAASVPKSGMSIDEQLQKAEELKTIGNKAYEGGELVEALKSWHHVSTEIS